MCVCYCGCMSLWICLYVLISKCVFVTEIQCACVCIFCIISLTVSDFICEWVDLKLSLPLYFFISGRIWLCVSLVEPIFGSVDKLDSQFTFRRIFFLAVFKYIFINQLFFVYLCLCLLICVSKKKSEWVYL